MVKSRKSEQVTCKTCRVTHYVEGTKPTICPNCANPVSQTPEEDVFLKQCNICQDTVFFKDRKKTTCPNCTAITKNSKLQDKIEQSQWEIDVSMRRNSRVLKGLDNALQKLAQTDVKDNIEHQEIFKRKWLNAHLKQMQKSLETILSSAKSDVRVRAS